MSPALTYLAAADDAMPSSLSERTRVATLHESMDIAIRARFKFAADDIPALKRLAIDRAAGVFDPFDLRYYRSACLHGGTYARLWEQEKQIPAWTASVAVAIDVHHRYSPIFLKDNRVCPGMAVLIPAPIGEDELDLPRHMGAQVWWCTSATKDTINLSRYRMHGDAHSPFDHSGAPMRRQSYDREQWKALQAAVAASGYDPETGIPAPSPVASRAP